VRGAAVTGAGVKCSAGNSPDELFSSLLTATPSFSLLESPVLAGGGIRVFAGRNDGFDPSEYFEQPQMRRLDRLHHLGVSAARDASLAAVNCDSTRLAVVVGVGFGACQFLQDQFQVLVSRGPSRVSPLSAPIGMVSSLAALISAELGAKGPVLTISTACASGASAIGEGLMLLRNDRADQVIAGGADALLTDAAVAFFHRADVLAREADDPCRAARPFDVDRTGFVISEGAGFVVLEREEDAAASQRTSLGVVRGYGATTDAHSLVVPEPSAEHAGAAMLAALRDADMSRADVGQINAHGTGTLRNDATEAIAIRHVYPTEPPPITAPKGVTGHLLAGSGAVELIASCQSASAGLIPPTAGLKTIDPSIGLDVVHSEPRVARSSVVVSNSFGFGGHNAVLVVST
jgi:3-oxoacyl-[acyl-carrier-protein] synthase II